jgi:site-specific DNA-methyltransferase (adenine-specific)
MGSGSTGAACIEEGRDFIGIEKDAEYFEVARRRLEHEQTKPRTMRMEMI